MKHIGNTLVALSAIALLAAIWAPGTWWQWLCTAIVLLFIGAATGIDRRHIGQTTPQQNSSSVRAKENQ